MENQNCEACAQQLASVLQKARRAKRGEDFKKAAEYYDMILEKDPASWEACFYSVYCRAVGCKPDEVFPTCRSVTDSTEKALELLKEDASVESEAKTCAVREMFKNCSAISGSLLGGRFPELKKPLNSYDRDSIVDDCCAAVKIMYAFGDGVDSLFDEYEELHNVSVSAWKQGLKMHEEVISYIYPPSVIEYNKRTIDSYVSKVRKYDPAYREKKAKGGCYVATAVYGSYDCPQVWTLRRYRDYTLAKTWYGRAFIHTYYAISPTLVRWFGDTEWFRKMWKGKLDRMVAKLQSEGVESTPYEDRIW